MDGRGPQIAAGLYPGDDVVPETLKQTGGEEDVRLEPLHRRRERQFAGPRPPKVVGDGACDIARRRHHHDALGGKKLDERLANRVDPLWKAVAQEDAEFMVRPAVSDERPGHRQSIAADASAMAGVLAGLEIDKNPHISASP
ncbi:hypothetical protein D3C73_418500 [compost metagenome]